jgi:GTPase
METKPPVPRAILIGVQLPSVDNVAHAADIEELGRLVNTLGYEVVGTISQKRDEIEGATVLGKGRLEELAAMTGGTGVVESMAIARKSKARERFADADANGPALSWRFSTAMRIAARRSCRLRWRG